MIQMVDPTTFSVDLKTLQPSGRKLTMCIAARRRMSDMRKVEVISSVMISRRDGEVQLWLNPGDGRPRAGRQMHHHSTELTDHSQAELDDEIVAHSSWWKHLADGYDQDTDEQCRIDDLNRLQAELDRQMKAAIRKTKLRFTWEGDDTGRTCQKGQ